MVFYGNKYLYCLKSKIICYNGFLQELENFMIKHGIVGITLIVSSGVYAGEDVSVADLEKVSKQAETMVESMRTELKKNIDQVQANISQLNDSMVKKIAETDARINQSVENTGKTIQEVQKNLMAQIEKMNAATTQKMNEMQKQING